jgi:hypothetical protein
MAGGRKRRGASADLPKKVFAAGKSREHAIQVSPIVIETASLDATGVYARLATRAEEPTREEAEARLLDQGHDVLEGGQGPGLAGLLWHV